MFKNFKAIAHIKTPIAAIDPIILDSIILAARLKKVLGDTFYAGNNTLPTEEQVRRVLDTILDKKCGVYCTSIGLGDNREYVGSWSKRWDDKNDDIVKFKGKERVDIGSGFYKNYHMPLVLKSYKIITFYVRGDMEEIKRLLENYIFYLGKKGSQGYGQIRKWEFEETDENYSIFKDGKLMRHVPAEACQEYIEKKMKKQEPIDVREKAIIPPYWRNDHRELCLMPDETT